MAEIGEGYVWPNTTIVSDGYRSIIHSRPSERIEATSFRYYGASSPILLPWPDVEKGIDDFVETVLAYTTKSGLPNNNLHQLWQDLMFERNDPGVTRFRRFEALLGVDPDEVSEDAIRQYLADAKALGEDAVDELAAAAAGKGIGAVLTAAQVRQNAAEHGTEISATDALQLEAAVGPVAVGGCSASDLGVAAARAARRSAGRQEGAIDDNKLAEIAGVSPITLKSSALKLPISFSLREADVGAHVVLRGKRSESRRFDLARLIGDQLIFGDNATLRPSTDSRTYRQKAQRAFAAEFLAPIVAVVEQSNGDYSDDRKEEIAYHFRVSPMVIDRLLKNNRIIERDATDFTEVA